jgi:hypothetical protein
MILTLLKIFRRNKMKKQLLIAAVAASMTSVAMADVSITGNAKANVTNGVASIEANLSVVGKSGDTSVVANISLDEGMNAGTVGTASVIATPTDSTVGTVTGAIVEDLYLTSSFQGVNVKVGEYRSGASELDQTSSAASTRYNLSTTMGGITATYEATKDAHDLTLGGTVAGVSIKHKMKSSDDTETWVSGSMSGVNLAWNQEHTDSGDANSTAITASTEFSGVTVTYVKIDTDAGTVSDGYVGKFTLAANTDASALGLSTAVAGNTVTFKKISIADADSNKVIINRKLASGATFEATYTDVDGDADVLDLELAVTF